MSKRNIITKKGLQFFLRVFVDLKDAFTPGKKHSRTKTGKRILIFNWRDTKHAYAGGAEVYIQEIATRWAKNGAQVTIFCGSDGRSKRNEVIDGVQIIRRGGFYFVYIWAFVYYLLKFRGKYDYIIDCENGIPFFTPLYAREKIFLVIHHVHQEVFLTSLKKPFAQLALFLEMKLMPFIYRKVQIITVSESSRQEILEHGLTAIDPIVIYNGVDCKTFAPGKKVKHPLIIYIGRLKKYKNIAVLIRAMKKVSAQVPEAELIIAGDGEDMQRLKRLVKQLELTEIVSFFGKITHDEKIALYKKAWVFVNPSLREGWGITTIEANASATPVVASDVPGLRDSVRHAHTGFLVPFGDENAFSEKIALLIHDVKLRRKMSKEARNWAKTFSWEYSAQQLFSLMTASSEAVTASLTPVMRRLRTQGVSYGEVRKYEK